MASRLTIAVFNEASGWSLPRALVERLEEAGEEVGVEVRAVGSRVELAEHLEQTDFLVGATPAPELMGIMGERLKWLQLTSSLGDEEASILPALRAGVKVTSGGAIRAVQAAEHALALALALTRAIDGAVLAQAAQRWASTELAGRVSMLEGSTAGLVCVGSIGASLAPRLRALGATPMSLGLPGVTPSEAIGPVVPMHDLGALLEKSDVVFVALPSTSMTRGIIGKAELSRLRAKAHLVVVCRGGVVDEVALAEAIRREKLGGAALDGFAAEPLPPNSALWSLPGLIVSPHIAAAGPRYWERAVEVICENLRRVARGGALIDELTPAWYQPRTR